VEEVTAKNLRNDRFVPSHMPDWWVCTECEVLVAPTAEGVSEHLRRCLGSQRMEVIKNLKF